MAVQLVILLISSALVMLRVASDPDPFSAATIAVWAFSAGTAFAFLLAIGVERRRHD